MTNAVYLASLVNSSGNNVTLQGGVVGSGTGIAFPATQVASSDANTLDDYEEGTWTPVISRDSANTMTFTNQNGYYVKVGSMVFVYANIGWSANSGGSGTYRVTGLPFAGSNQTNYYPSLFMAQIAGITFAASTTYANAAVYPNTTYAKWTTDGSAANNSAITTVAASGYVNIQGVYQATS